MSDNQTRMRSMLDLIESVDQGKKIKLNEGLGGALTGGAIGSMVGGLPGAAIGGWIGDKVTGDADADKEVSEDSDSSSDVEELANDALDAAALSIQNALGVEHGDFAGMFFTGEAGETILEILREYAREEMKNQSENDNSQTLDEGAMKRWLEDQAVSMEKEDFVANADEYGMSSEEAAEWWNNCNGVDDEGDSNTRSNQFESTKSKTGKLPSISHIKKMCKDGKTVAEICKMHPDCDRAELKKMVADCKDKLSESGEGNSSSREKSVSDSDEGYDKWDSKHPDFAKNYKKYKTSNPEGTLKSFIAHLKKGALAEGVRLKKFRQVADILKTLPENNRKILAKRHCKIFENHNPRFNSKKFMNYIGLNEDGYGNGEIEVNFINSGHGTTLGMKKVQAGSITLDNYGRPVMKVSSPFDAGNTLMANFDSKTGGWVVDLD